MEVLEKQAKMRRRAPVGGAFQSQYRASDDDVPALYLYYNQLIADKSD
jgi:hypothetical protein